jgi:alkanesulfonate monooxygenase SsuD/methylene tetrahydromethanopterin reductase-like flavin-dependent oxidoreductase (luciferase family)
MTPSAPGGAGWPVHPWVAESRRSVRFSVVGTFLNGWPQLRDFVLRAEDLGFAAYWANDHPGRSMDCWSVLTALAMVTTRIRLISLVSCVYYRPPALLARQAADVDILSGGRLVLGLGAGDDANEFGQLGLAFPPAGARQQKLAETLESTRGYLGLSSGAPGHQGQIRPVPLSPGPVQQPRIPVLIGGGGERTTLRLVAQYADVSNFGPHEWTGGAFSYADVRRKCEVLRQHCEAIGRPVESILRSHYTPLLVLAGTQADLARKKASIAVPDANLRTAPLFATVEDAVTHYQALVDAGMQYFLASVDGQDTQTLDLIAQHLLPALAGRPG